MATVAAAAAIPARPTTFVRFSDRSGRSSCLPTFLLSFLDLLCVEARPSNLRD